MHQNANATHRATAWLSQCDDAKITGTRGERATTTAVMTTSPSTARVSSRFR